MGLKRESASPSQPAKRVKAEDAAADGGDYAAAAPAVAVPALPPPRTGLERAAAAGGAANATAKAPKAEKAAAAAAAAAADPLAADAGAAPSPYPDLHRPSPEECAVALETLRALHGAVDTPNAAASDVAAPEEEEEDPDAFTVLDQLVATILSQNTTDSNSWPAFLKLKAAFPTWDAARTADVAAIAAPIRSAGLSNIKSERIKAILADLHARLGRCSLEHLRRMSDGEAKVELRRFKGVGEKTVACVLMFALGRAEFPVDTHVWKLALALGWVPPRATRQTAYAHLNARVPAGMKHELHVLLVEHGKRFRNAAGPLGEALRAARLLH